MKILELLKKNNLWITGYQTRLIVDDEHGFTVRTQKNNRGDFLIVLYSGKSEEQAVKIFVENEKK